LAMLAEEIEDRSRGTRPRFPWIVVGRCQGHRGRHDHLNYWIRHPIVDLSTCSAANQQTDCDQSFQMPGHVRLRAAEDVAEILYAELLRSQAHEDGEAYGIAHRREDPAVW